MSVRDGEKGLETGDGDDYTSVRMCLMPQSCTLQWSGERILLRVFYRDSKKSNDESTPHFLSDHRSTGREIFRPSGH